jgi:uncharacterized protein (DUF362 family)
MDYESGRVFDAVRKAVELVGGMDKFISPGMRVLIKPNLLSARPPEDAVCTHPEAVRAVVKLVREAGGIPLIGDSPGGYGANIEDVFEKSGMGAMAKEEGADLVKFTASKFVEGVPIARYVFDCDRVISVPKLKTHTVTVLTAALKNTYGMVTGLYKAEQHARAPREEDFARIIAHVYSLTRPHLTVLDGIVGMEADGPSAGKPRSMNLVMAGEDAVAIDSCAARVIGLEPLDIAVTAQAYRMKLGEADMAKIELVGDDINGFVRTDFLLPQTTALKILPKALVNSIAALARFRPHINFNACKKCNLCKITCPVSAITIEKTRCFIDYHKCVRCMCCHEVCPYKAIYIKRTALAKLIWGYNRGAD